MEQYTFLAKYYDKLMKDFDYCGYVKFVQKYLVGTGADLCTGTGRISLWLAQNGRNVTGVDTCPNMLNTARENARKLGLKIQWICLDAAEFLSPSKLDFACCICDGLNYMNGNQVEKLLKNVTSYVKSCGYFVFDISTSFKLKEVIGNNVFCEDLENISYIWSNFFDEKQSSVEMQIGFFERQNGDVYKRVDESHFQYAHETTHIFEILSSSWSVEVFDGESFSSLKKESRRALFVCKKN